MLNRLRNNLALKLTAILIAVVAWAYLRLTPNPVIAARFVQQVSVPIATTGLPPEEVASYTERTATVAVDVGRSGSAIKPEEVRAVLNLSDRGPGVYNIPVEVIAPKFEIRSLSPATVTLQIEKVERREVPVTLHYTGNVRPNFIASDVRVEPATATIDAKTSDLARVAGVRVDVPFPSQSQNFDSMVRPVAIDERGSDLGAVAVQPNLLRVRVHFVAPQSAPKPSATPKKK